MSKNKKHDYVPREQLKRLQWGEEWVKEAKIDGTSLGLTQQEIDDAETEVKQFRKEMDKSIQIENAKEAQTKLTKKSDSTFTKNARKLSGKIKVNNKYDEGVGKRYHIIGDDISIDPATSKPEIKTRKVPTGWELSFNLLGYFDAVKIFRKRPSATDFIFLAVDTSSPYIDTDKMENGTEYYCYFMIGDEMVGVQSDVVVINV